jgi:hypothetical protein
VERNTNEHSIVAADGKAALCRIHRDGRERYNLLLASHAIVVAQRERPLAEAWIPLDAVEKISKRLHAITRCQIAVEPARGRWTSGLRLVGRPKCQCGSIARTIELLGSQASRSHGEAIRLPFSMPVSIEQRRVIFDEGPKYSLMTALPRP